MSNNRACKDMEGLLVLYHYGELSPRENSEVEAHLDKCGFCLRELDAIKSALESVPASVPAAGSVGDAVRGVMCAVRYPEERKWKVRMVPAYIAAAAAAAAVVLSVYVPDLLQKAPRQNQVMAQADWEMLENFDIAKDYNTIMALDDFESLDQQNQQVQQNR